jgi:hypothetical protein
MMAFGEIRLFVALNAAGTVPSVKNRLRLPRVTEKNSEIA